MAAHYVRQREQLEQSRRVSPADRRIYSRLVPEATVVVDHNVMVHRHVDRILAPTSLESAFAGDVDLATDAALWLLSGKALTALRRSTIRCAQNMFYVGDGRFPSLTHAFVHARRVATSKTVVGQGGVLVDVSEWDAYCV